MQAPLRITTKAAITRDRDGSPRMTASYLWQQPAYGHRDDSEATEMAAEVCEQIGEDFRAVLVRNEPMRYAPPKPIPTYEEMAAQMDRAMNPTPAERAANMLNQRTHFDMPPPWSEAWMTGEAAWLEMRRAVKRVKLDAPASYVEPGAFRARQKI